jgi:hypothetical protein
MSNESDSRELVQPIRRVSWKSAIMAGLIAGGIFLVVSRGIPWFSSGFISPTVMGREIKPSPDLTPGLSLSVAMIHVVVSIAYALLLAPLVSRLRSTAKAVSLGGLLGLGLYVINFVIFSQMYNTGFGQRELAPILTHIAFGMVATATYRGLAKRPVQQPA